MKYYALSGCFIWHIKRRVVNARDSTNRIWCYRMLCGLTIYLADEVPEERDNVAIHMQCKKCSRIHARHKRNDLNVQAS